MVKFGKPQKLDDALQCPTCSRKLDGAQGLGHDKAPGPGDVTVCIECASILEFVGPDCRSLQLLPDGGLDKLEEDQQLVILSARAAILYANDEKKGRK